MFLATQNKIKETLRAQLKDIESYEELLTDVVNICLYFFESNMYVTPAEKHMLVKVSYAGLLQRILLESGGRAGKGFTDCEQQWSRLPSRAAGEWGIHPDHPSPLCLYLGWSPLFSVLCSWSHGGLLSVSWAVLMYVRSVTKITLNFVGACIWTVPDRWDDWKHHSARTKEASAARKTRSDFQGAYWFFLLEYGPLPAWSP